MQRFLSASVSNLVNAEEYSVAMKNAHGPSETIGNLIDRIERVREELLAIQRSMERMESVESAASHDPSKKI